MRRLKMVVAAVIAVTVGLMTVSCSDEGTSGDKATPSAMPSSAAAPSMTFEEAYRKLPMDGTKDLPITWELSEAPNTGEVLAARRALVLNYWLMQATDWIPVIEVGQFVYSDRFYQKILAPYANDSSVGNPSVGPIWVKYMGVEKTGPDRAVVTFCTDLGYWHGVKDGDFKVRKGRANLESYVMERTQTGDGERRWVADRRLDRDVAVKPKYGAACTKWAQHKP